MTLQELLGDKYKEGMTQEELTEALADVTILDQQDDVRLLQEEVAALKRDKRISANKAQFLQMGYDEKTADSISAALEDGDAEAVVKGQKKFLSDFEQKIRNEILNNTPAPRPGEPADPDAEAFQKMTWTQKAELKNKNPELYKTLSGG